MRPLTFHFRGACLLVGLFVVFAVVADTAAKHNAGTKRKRAGNDDVEAGAVARDWDLRVVAFSAFRRTGLAEFLVALVFAGCAG